MKKLLSLITLFCVFSVFNTKASNIRFYQISTQHGLSQNTVRAILVDQKGFLWAGSMDGLNRYDGYNIINYEPQPGNPKSLLDHRIKEIFQDRDGYIWIKSYKNEFNCYDPITDSFVEYVKPTLDSDYYDSYYEASNGDVWLWGNYNGCLRIQKKDGQLISERFLDNLDFSQGRVFRFLFEDSKNDIWIGGDTGLFHIEQDKVSKFYEKKNVFSKAVELGNKLYFTTRDVKGGIIEYDMRSCNFVEIESFAPGHITNACVLSKTELLIITRVDGVFSYNTITRKFIKKDWMEDKALVGEMDFIKDKQDGVWIYNNSGTVWYYNVDNKTIKKMTLIPSDIAKMIDMERYNVLIDSRGLFWITTYGNGLWCYNPQNDSLENFKYVEGENSPVSDYLLSITDDKYGNIWVGSEYAGIIKLVKPNYDIRIVKPEKEVSIGKSNNVRVIFSDSFDKMWVGTKNGNLYVYDYDITSKKHVNEGINPYTLTEDRKQRIWVGTKGNGLYILDAKSYEQIANFSDNDPDSDTFIHNTIFHVFKDNKERIWASTFGGGLVLAEENGTKFTFRRFFQNDGNRSYFRYLYQDSKERIWAGTSGGVIRFNPEDFIENPKSYTSYALDLTQYNSLNSNDIKTIFEDSDGDIWIGTSGGGLNKYVEGTKDKPEHFVAYQTKDGLAGDIVSGIMEDEEKNLWISTENGITKFNKTTNTMVVFNFSDKTYGNHFNENANILCKTGNMIWGSLDGLLIFNPKPVVANKILYPVALTDFYIFDQKVEVGVDGSPLKKSITYTDNITLKYDQNTFTIEFATLLLQEINKNKYMYTLENYDKHWSVVTNHNTATYKQLSPGKYIFKVKGTNRDGLWNDEVTEIAIEIRPPFWKSIYAYIIYMMLFAIVSYIVFRLIYKFNALNNDIKVEKQLTNYKLRFFTNISHEFRTPLTLINGAVENIMELKDVPSYVSKQINVLSRNSKILNRLIDQLLEFRKIQNNVLTLNLTKTDIVDFVQNIHSEFKEIAEQNEMEYNFLCTWESYVMYIDRKKVDKIFYNLLSNAFKFTPKGGCIDFILNIDTQQKKCILSIKDSGIGIAKDRQHLLFSRFMQINFSSEGTGVGLSLVKEFVEVHKGRVWYDSNPEGGSIFNIELSTDEAVYDRVNFVDENSTDIIQEEEEDSNTACLLSENAEFKLPEIDDTILSNYKLLVIDDNNDIRNFLQDEFSKYFMVEVAENGKEGLDKAVQINPNMIICDVMMPEMDGFEVTCRLKDDFQTCHIPIILLTAHSSSEHQLEGIKSGADAYIVKPFSMKYLITRVFKLIEQREQLKKRFSKEYILDNNLINYTDKDKEFYNFIEQILEENYNDSNFSVEQFSEMAKQRRTVFYKKVKGITGFSPNELIKIKRMKKSAELLLKGEMNVSEISYAVGFDDPFYFSKCFKAHFKCSPSKYGHEA